MNRKVILVQFLDNRVLSKIRSLLRTNSVAVVSLTNGIALRLSDASIPFTNFTDYVSSESFARVGNMAAETAREWYKQDKLSEVCTFENVNMGEFSELFLTAYFIEVFKRIIILQKIRETQRPETIIYSSEAEPFTMGLHEDLWAKTIEEYARRNDLQTSVIRRGSSFRFLARENLKYLLERCCLLSVFSQGLSRGVLRVSLKRITTRFTRCLRAGRVPRKADIIFSGPSSLFVNSVALMEVLIQNDYSIEIITRENYQVRQFFLKHGISMETFMDVNIDRLHKQTIRNRIKRFKKHIRENFFVEGLSPFTFEGINLWPIIADRLSYELKYVYPRLIEEMEIFCCKLAGQDIKCVVVPTSAAPVAKAVLRQASSMGVPTVEIQHGVTKWAPSYLPLVCLGTNDQGLVHKAWGG
jgi:hypothetical protein